MSFDTIHVGETHLLLLFTWQTKSGVAIDLTNAVVTFRIRNLKTNVTVNGQGSVTLLVPASGTGFYKPSANDFPVGGQYEIQGKATYPGNDPLYSNRLEVTAELPI